MNVPIAVSIALSSLITMFYAMGQFDLASQRSAQKIATGIDQFALLAIPFFILSGLLMGKGGIARRLIDFANALVGRFTGGLSYVNVLTCMMFGSISGSAVAAVSSVGGFMIPEMNKKGYGKEFNVSVTTTAATTGLMIPPSNIMIVYALVATQSVAAMFMAGVFPGIIFGLSLMVVCGIISKKRGYGVGEEASEGFRKFIVFELIAAAAFLTALLALYIIGRVASRDFLTLNVLLISFSIFCLLSAGLIILYLKNILRNVLVGLVVTISLVVNIKSNIFPREVTIAFAALYILVSLYLALRIFQHNQKLETSVLFKTIRTFIICWLPVILITLAYFVISYLSNKRILSVIIVAIFILLYFTFNTEHWKGVSRLFFRYLSPVVLVLLTYYVINNMSGTRILSIIIFVVSLLFYFTFATGQVKGWNRLFRALKMTLFSWYISSLYINELYFNTSEHTIGPVGYALRFIVYGCVASVLLYLYGSEAKQGLTHIALSLEQALMSLLLMVIVLGGILKGYFTATEAAAIAVVYSFLLAVAVYREVKIKDLPQILLQCGITTAIVMILVGTSSAMSSILTTQQIPQNVSAALISISENKYVILIIINLLLLFVGTFMDMTPAVLIFAPIFLPVIDSLEIHRVHFGALMVANLCIGICTPPVGTCLFVGCGVGNTTIAKIIKHLIPFFIAMIAALMLVTYIPAVSMWLPNALKLISGGG